MAMRFPLRSARAGAGISSSKRGSGRISERTARARRSFRSGTAFALIALSLVVIGARVYRITAGGPREAPLSRSQRREIGHALAVWLAFAVSIALLKSLGFLIAFGLLTLFIVAVIYRRPWKVALAVAVAGALGFHLVFAIALGVGLPTGIFGF
jgi:hypothetical protein